VGDRTIFLKKGNQDTFNPFNNRARENKHGGPINLDGEKK
jgi:hypothetical protein